ncbi:MAG: hypothetical protein P9M14_05585 [Candidatus Alcyoniella australis]|nr:hypothetical protein [Candidatus Alcyoniella australis]
MRARNGPMAMIAAALLSALLLGLATLPAAAETNIAHSATLSLEYDDNVLRTPSNPDQDFLLRLLYSFDLLYLPRDAHRLELRYLIGGKKYIDLEREDTLVNSLFLGYVNSSFNLTDIGVSANFKLHNLRGSRSSYDKLLLDAFYQRGLPADFTIKAAVGFDRFDYIELDYFDYWVHRYNGSFSRNFSRHVQAGLDYVFSQKRYAFGAFRRVGQGGGDVILVQRNTRRVDDRHEPQVWLDLRWRIRAHLGYALRIKDSNSYGESYTSHVLSTAFSMPVIDRLSLHWLGIFQWRDSHEEVTLPHSGGVEDEEEHLNAVALRATIHAHKILDIETRFSRYWSNEPDDNFRFVKDVVSVGFQFSF